MVKKLYFCSSNGCQEFFSTQSMANLHLRESCGIKKKLKNHRPNGSPHYRRPQRIDVALLLSDFCRSSIGKGGYGQIFPAKMGKLELIAKHISQEKSLLNEMHVYKEFWSKERIPEGIPRYYGLLEKDELAFIVIERLDFSLADLIKQFEHKSFGEHDRIQLLIDLTKILEFLHKEVRFAHRDIKENNIMFKDGLIYLIDFGLAQQLPDPDSQPVEKNSVGNLYLLDIRGHRGHWQDMTADLQTISFMIADFYFPEGLPWQIYIKELKSSKITYKEASEKICESKERLIAFGNPKIPKYLHEFMKEVSNKIFGFKIDHQKLIAQLKNALNELPKQVLFWKGKKLPPVLPKEIFEDLNSQE